jgi:ubiquinone/menaquinone biosynthesis C-methylase UbiE
VGLLARLLEQCRRPTGCFGRWMAKGMNRGHFKLTIWGLEAVEIADDARILDIGCGGGRTLGRLAERAPRGHTVGIDYSEDSLAVTRRINRRLVLDGRIGLAQATVSALPFADAVFDLATAVETFYFWPDPHGDLAEVRRVLRPGGELVMIAGMYRGSRFDRRNMMFEKAGNLTSLTVDEFEEALASAGYSDVRVSVAPRQGWVRAAGRRPSQEDPA